MARDDLSRNVFCILGMPIDVGGMPSVLCEIKKAVAKRARFFITTPNLNHLVNMKSNPDFRESVNQSDLCPVDGMPIIWIAWFLGVPIKSRIAGSDIFDALKAEFEFAKPLRVFLFGGQEGVAEEACQTLNARPSGLRCVGSFYPGFGSIDDMSRDDIIDRINSSNADFLVVALGAQKGQLWLLRNHYRLLIPVRAHLGAVINFQAATVKRAPLVARRLGFEWLWRIKEEPYLWRRYWRDGGALLHLLFTSVLPLVAWTWWLGRKCKRQGQDLVITQDYTRDSIALRLSGPAVAQHVDKALPVFRDAISTKKQVIIDFSRSCVIDSRFLGLLLMLRKKVKSNSAPLTIIGVSPQLKRIFRYNDLDTLLDH